MFIAYLIYKFREKPDLSYKTIKSYLKVERITDTKEEKLEAIKNLQEI